MRLRLLSLVGPVADRTEHGSEQEHKRTQESSHVDDRTEHEIYVHPFMRSVQAGVASVMCSYSACEVSGASQMLC